jgi:protein O-mannosyl-transferase
VAAAKAAGEDVPLWMPVLLIVAGLASYGATIDLPFVFDDHTAIIDNANIRQLWPLTVSAGAPVQSAMAGRPVVALSLALNYAVGELSPSVYHAWNLGLLILTALVLFGIVRRTLLLPRLRDRFGKSSAFIACVCALLWIVHPLQTEVVDYVTQRTESTMGLFYLLTLYAAIRGMTVESGSSLKWELAAIAACAGGMASKESMVTAPVMVFLYDAVFCQPGLPPSREGGTIRPIAALRARPLLYAGLALTWIILAVLIIPGPRSRSAGFQSGVTPWMYLLNQPGMILTYLRLAILPIGQVLDYGVPRAVSFADVWLPFLSVAALAVATLAAWRWRPDIAFLGTWFFVTLAPSSSILPIATEVGAERRMYLPLAAVIVLIVMSIWSLIERRRRSSGTELRDWRIPAAALVVCVVLVTLTVRRNLEYRTALGIWQTVLDRYPHGRAHYNIGIELKQQGRRSEALDHYRLALPESPEAHYAIGFEAAVDGRHEEAIAHCREFLRLMPDDQSAPLAYVILGRSLEATGRLDEAAEAYRREIQMRPGEVDGRGGLASVLISQQRFDQAVVVLQDLIRLDARNPSNYANLGIAYVGLDRSEDAVNAFTRAVELAPENPSFHHNLGNALAGVARLDEAIAEYRRSLALAPGKAAVHQALGMVLVAKGRREEAVAELKRAATLDPENPEIRSDLAALLGGTRLRP